MKVVNGLVAGILLLIVSSCGLEEAGQGLNIFSFNYDFSESTHDWRHGFADYPAGVDDSAFFELKYEYTNNPLGSGRSIMLSGNNHSDDLFMYIKKKITGLIPDADYTLTFDVEFASNASADAAGVGGAPGESVFLKVGATGMEPTRVMVDGMYVMNIEKGNQAQSGRDMVVIGNIATIENATGYSIISRNNLATSNDNPLVGRTNSHGELWLIVGTDSGFEGVTTLYYTSVFVALSAPN